MSDEQLIAQYLGKQSFGINTSKFFCCIKSSRSKGYRNFLFSIIINWFSMIFKPKTNTGTCLEIWIRLILTRSGKLQEKMDLIKKNGCDSIPVVGFQMSFEEFRKHTIFWGKLFYYKCVLYKKSHIYKNVRYRYVFVQRVKFVGCIRIRWWKFLNRLDPDLDAQHWMYWSKMFFSFFVRQIWWSPKMVYQSCLVWFIRRTPCWYKSSRSLVSTWLPVSTILQVRMSHQGCGAALFSLCMN